MVGVLGFIAMRRSVRVSLSILSVTRAHPILGMFTL
jgi:hypothetical protein